MGLTANEISALFAAQRAAAPELRARKARQRWRKIKAIRNRLLDRTWEKRICDALHADLGKHPAEVIATEIGPVLMAIKHVKHHLRDWMRPRHVPAPLNLSGLCHRLVHQPKGNCLILSPWNYPLQLTLNPLVHAIAAGNPVLLKPSEVSAHTTQVLDELLSGIFPKSEVAVVPGAVETATALLELPFHHIYFTGSPQVGRIVMQAAVRHLASVTLELGGKSPAIVDDSVNLRRVAKQTAWAKTINAGQTCIAPDYLLLPEKRLADFVEYFAAGVRELFDPEGRGVRASSDYGRIINERHARRIQGLLEDARKKGATVHPTGQSEVEARFIAPTLVTGVTEDMAILHEEIFGPVLPVVTYRKLAEVPAILARRPHPLSFYIMSQKRKHIDYLLEHSSAGSTVINEYMVGSLNPNLPFGGINESGIGKANGYHSFAEFSNARGVVERTWGTFRFLYPPFGPKTAGIVRFLYRYL
ncbi:MAG: aldehyde dehydrogenase family protein [Bacteroidota bacterium]